MLRLLRLATQEANNIPCQQLADAEWLICGSALPLGIVEKTDTFLSRELP